MKILGIIPARFGSTRFEGKPLVNIHGKPMIQWVYEACDQVLDHVIVATDDSRIEEAVKQFNGDVVMTSSAHETGTNRCLEAFEIYSARHSGNFDVIINIQGDEPMLRGEQILQLAACFEDASTEMATLIYPVKTSKELTEPNDVFVIFTRQSEAIYFSRSPLPHVRGENIANWINHHQYYKHIGMYGFTPKALAEFAAMQKTNLEKTESLEQNRWIENGRKIKLAITNHKNLSVDTPEDLQAVKSAMEANGS